ncbi:endonuclease V [bacterium]|nr:endonuclease V [bacterium]
MPERSSRLVLPSGLSPRQAMALQTAWRKRLRLERELDPRRVRLVAGADLSMECHGDYGFAAIVVLDLESGETLDVGRAEGRLTFPYVPGLLAFREVPLIQAAFATLQVMPEVLLCDGQGYAHPRRMGLACMAGLVLGIPTVGCAKSRLCGEERQPARERGRFTWLVDGGERIGMTLRTRHGVAPVYVSPGHRIDFHAARALVLRCATAYRLPEPIRQAHAEVNGMRKTRGG